MDGGDDETGTVSEAGVRIEDSEEHGDGTDLELDLVQRQAGEVQGVQEPSGVVRSRVVTWGSGVGAEKNVLLSGHATQNVLIHFHKWPRGRLFGLLQRTPCKIALDRAGRLLRSSRAKPSIAWAASLSLGASAPPSADT